MAIYSHCQSLILRTGPYLSDLNAVKKGYRGQSSQSMFLEVAFSNSDDSQLSKSEFGEPSSLRSINANPRQIRSCPASREDPPATGEETNVWNVSLVVAI